MSPKAVTVMMDTTCTRCGDKFDCSTGVGAKKNEPAPGDISMCSTCGHVMEFDQNLKLQDMSEQKTVKVLTDPRLMMALAAFAEYKEKVQH